MGACSSPAERTDTEAGTLGFTRAIVAGAPFSHVVYRPARQVRGDVLHVYIGGDGSPRRAVRSLPPDPTPRRPVLLPLLALDPAPGVYLGRPCYHGLGADPPCRPWYWTLGRYGDAVVDSMAQAVRRLGRETGAGQVVLIGHSGGGTLAMLMAERLAETRAVVTLGGNLDVAAWTGHHGFTALSGSLDPARRPPLPSEIVQIHLRGTADEVVPPALTDAVIARQPHAVSHVYPAFDHECCWQRVWPAVLAELDRALRPQP
jgi:pimeloyl-ACP methyl ester carboxylesterase